MSVGPDLRLLLPAVAAWGGVLVGLGLPWWAWLAPGLACFGVAAARRSPLAVAVAAVAVACAGGAALRSSGHEHSLVAGVAAERGYVTATLEVTSDPMLHQGRFDSYVVVHGSVTALAWRGETAATHAPVVVIGSEAWRRVRLGSSVRVSGRLSAAGSPDLAAVLTATRDPRVLHGPAPPLRAADGVRAAIRDAASGSSPLARELVPGLVIGDDAGLSPEVVEQFRTAGLTHLTAVSGTNLTLLVGFLLVLGRWVGVRGRGLPLLGALGVIGFVVLARPEPSVLRAAVMGAAALAGLGAGGRERGVRALSFAVLVLLLFDPWLGRSVGFALSASATAGILFVAPPLRDALLRWTPRAVAEAVAVPFAAQLACTPLVAAISGTVSLVAVVANLLVAPVVGPATVLGLLGGLVLLVAPPLGRALGRGAGWCADWILLVADRASALPVAAVGWPAGLPSLAVLTVGCVALALTAPRFARSAPRSLFGVGVLLLVMVRPVPTFGWPPSGWVMVACAVGQGDGIVLNAGGGAGLVVDTGPDPAVMDRCLRRLGVVRVPVLFLTHFHADHVDGLSGVLHGRSVAEVAVTRLRDPPEAADHVDRVAQAAGAPVRTPSYGEVGEAGRVRWQVLGPVGLSDSGPNDASLVLLVEVAGIRLLLPGDAEPEAQRRLSRTIGPLHVDVLKVPHHGSRYQDDAFLDGLRARLAVVTVGADNDYGHPSPETLADLRRSGMQVARTDLDGDIAVVVDGDGRLRVVTRR